MDKSYIEPSVADKSYIEPSMAGFVFDDLQQQSIQVYSVSVYVHIWYLYRQLLELY